MLVNIINLINLVNPSVKQHIYTKFQDDALTLPIRLEELLKFLYISSKYPQLKKTFIPLTQEVDDIWHELILQTAYYQKLCEALPGGKIIHHESIRFHDYQVNFSRKELIQEMLQWLFLYVKNFGSFTEDRIKFWFFIKTIKETLNLSLSELNNYARIRE